MHQKTNIGIWTAVVLLTLGVVETSSFLQAQTPSSPAVPKTNANAALSGKLNESDAPAAKETPEIESVASKEIKDAIESFKKRDFDGAMKSLQEAIRKDRDLPPAQVIMAQLFSQARVPQGVRSYLEQAVMENPTDPEAYVIMGDLAVSEGRFTEAKMLYDKADGLIASFQGSEKPKKMLKPRILSGLAMIDEAQNFWADAQKQLEEWIKLEPTNPSALQRLAHVMFFQKNAAGALEKLKEAAKADPTMLTPEAVLGRYYEQAEDRENAKHWMAEALRIAPDNLQTRLFVGQWALEIEDLEQAKTQAAEALKIDPNSLDAKILSGVVAMFQKDYAAAERFFESAHVQKPSNFAAANNLALVLVEQSDDVKRKRGLEYAKGNIQQNQQSAEAASTYGWALFKNGQLDEAQKMFSRAVSSGSVAPDTAYYIACLSYERGQETEAKQWLDMALKTTGPFAMRKEAQELLAKLPK